MAAITITGSDTSTGNLTMSDRGSTDANRGELVTWIIGPNSGVSSITEIQKYESSTNVFESGPAPLGGNSKNWQGKIKNQLEVPATETYFIKWMDSSGGGPHTYDPTIRINR